MSFDKHIRNLLAKTVTACRRRLIEDVTDQLGGVFGLHPDGTVLALKEMTHLSPDQAASAGRLRDLLDHYTAGAAGTEKDRRKSAYERMTLEISFTILNRLAALRLCEERGLVVECVRRGTASDGFRLFERVSGGALGGRYDTYQVFLECLFDELALDLGVLFDRMAPQSAVFPTERCMEDVLAELNKNDLTHLWTEDETIGWIYQYFNPPEERKAMRAASAAPRNSRELAVRNQFFTPRYVVEFLTDNTLGRIWYEMRKGDTVLKEECRYLVRRPNEVFLLQGQEAPAAEVNEADLSQEELLKKTVYIEHRTKKDPRDLRVLDPACGSGHFLLYAFDLLERIYEEAWEDTESPKSEYTDRTLHEDFDNLDDLRRAVPKLVIEHNLHGIDIDPRAVQIAALALWLRAQKTWKILGIKAAERPQVTKSNIVTAEPMPGEEDMKKEFTASLKPRVLGQLVDVVFDKMKLAGEAGSLLKIEEEIKDAVAEAKKQWFEMPKPEQTVLFPELVSAKSQQMELRFDLTGVTDERFWGQAEERILAALKDYAERTENGRAVRRRLFAEDAARGFAFIDLCRKRYDIILMNPPFGEFTGQTKAFAQTRYPNTKNDIYGAFVERTIAITTTNGHIGGITPRTWLTLTRFEGLREAILDRVSLDYLIDLGYNVLESMAEVSVFVLSRFKTSTDTAFLRAFSAADKMSKVGKLVDELARLQIKEVLLADINRFRNIPQKIFAFGLPKSVLDSISQGQTIEGSGHFAVKQGIATGDNDRFLRLQTEIPASSQPREWIPYAKGGNFGMFHTSLELAVKWHRNGLEIKTRAAAEYGSASRTIKNEGTYFTPGLTFSLVSQAGFSVRVLPAGCIYDMGGPCIFASSQDTSWPIEALLAVVNSSFTQYCLTFITDSRHWHVITIQSLPLRTLGESERDVLSHLASDCASQLSELSVKNETDILFDHPMLGTPSSLLKQQSVFSHQSANILRGRVASSIEQIDSIVSSRFSFDTSLLKDLREKRLRQMFENWPRDEEDTARIITENIISWVIGCVSGRWDARIALEASLAPKLPDPFDPLPICPPGMLVGPDGLPAEPGHIISEEWLRARLDANTLPSEGAVKNPIIPDSDYPLRINWDGVLVDDPGFNGAQPHREDIVRRVREVLDLLWKDKANEIEQEACDILGVSDLRDYFRKPTGFFQDHLKRYSKSRRKAPIYQPLSTPSGSYTLWFYYHRLTDQTLYAAVNKYVEPKIAEVDRGLTRIENDLKAASGRGATRLRDRLNETQTFLGELRDLREELLRIAELPYKPNLNDGVIINAAPLHNLFRLRSWANDTKKVWGKLEKGDYDWAHLAYTIWPDRVQEACKKDRSIAIVHGLEDICEVEAPAAKKKGGRGRRKKEASR